MANRVLCQSQQGSLIRLYLGYVYEPHLPRHERSDAGLLTMHASCDQHGVDIPSRQLKSHSSLWNSLMKLEESWRNDPNLDAFSIGQTRERNTWKVPRSLLAILQRGRISFLLFCLKTILFFISI